MYSRITLCPTSIQGQLVKSTATEQLAALQLPCWTAVLADLTGHCFPAQLPHYPPGPARMQKCISATIEKIGKDCAFWRQFNEKPSVIWAAQCATIPSSCHMAGNSLPNLGNMQGNITCLASEQCKQQNITFCRSQPIQIFGHNAL